MEATETINDSSKLIAKALKYLKDVTGNDNDDERYISIVIDLLEEALAKLTNKM